MLYLSDLGPGWGAMSFETREEYLFVELNLRTDESQQFFVGGYCVDEDLLDRYYPRQGFNFPIYFWWLYSPRQKGNICSWGIHAVLH